MEIPATGRGEILNAVADQIRQHLDELAYLESWETGKPLRQASAEIWLAGDSFPQLAGRRGARRPGPR